MVPASRAGGYAGGRACDRNATPTIPFDDAYSALVHTANARDVRTTIVHGRLVMEDRRILTVDVAEVRTRMRALEARIRAAVAKGLK